MTDQPIGTPASRLLLLPAVAEHAEALARSSLGIADAHREAAEALATWIAAHHRPGQSLGVIVVCTGNSRRSVLGATLGNIAAAYWGLPDVRFTSGGTDPTACNPRTIATMRAIGVIVEPTDREAQRGEPGTPNPVYRVRWGDPSSGMEAEEFSKRYDDPANPPTGFAALMVCDEADAGCPTVRGASLRLSIPFADPKHFDNTPEEPARYAERRDDIGRLMLWALRHAGTLIEHRSARTESA